jgi:cysteine-rich repeat protein
MEHKAGKIGWWVAAIVLCSMGSGCADDSTHTTEDGSVNTECGDGLIEGQEECDDGNRLDGDGCDPQCAVEPGWACHGEPSACSNECGNGVVDPGEECDGADVGEATCETIPGGFTGGTLACSASCGFDTTGCVLPGCGDGEVVMGEECDDGNDSNEDACLNNCTLNQCGDGYVWTGEEECDDGNTANTDGCLNDCRTAVCGDGYVWTNEEACDDGQNGDPCDGCLDDCTSHTNTCGDGYVCGTEACDDGQNGDPCDGCLDDCTLPAADLCGGCNRPYDRDVTVPYPIHATWMFGRNDACAWQNALEDFHRQGGQTVWQFGPEFTVRTADELRTDQDLGFTDCMQGGMHCVDRALADLQGLHANNTVVNWLTYAPINDFSDEIMTCPTADRKITIGNRTYWRIVLPHHAGQNPCDFNGNDFDVLFTYFEGSDDMERLLTEADGMQMDVLLGMPCAPHDSAQPWNIDLTLRPAFLDWARRVLTDYHHRHSSHPSFVGVYQSFEVPLVASGLQDIYDTYGMIGDIIDDTLPSGLYVLSPYWDVNTDQGAATVASVKAGFKRLARQSVDIIAPQDGRGTGKGALYWPFQESETIDSVDPRLGDFPNVDGSATFDEQFNASSRELAAAVREAVGELQSQENITVTLWINIEAFEYTSHDPCSYTSLDRTDKSRLDWALTMAGAFPTRLISFMWDPFYTCLDGGYSQSLHAEIESDHDRPIAANAFFFNSGGDDGIIVRGFNLTAAGTVFHLTWYDSGWNIHSTTVSAGWTSPGWGATNDRSPLLDEVWLPFDNSDLAPSFYVHIVVEGPGNLQAHHQYSLGY